MAWELTAIFRRVDGGFVARVAELPDVIAQGANLDEARENLRTATWRMIQSRRMKAEQELADSSFMEERVVVTSTSDNGYQITFLGT